MVQQLKVFSFKSDNWSTISQTQVVKGKNQFSKVIFWFPNTASSTYTNTYTAYTLNIKDINNCWLQYPCLTKYSQYVQHKYDKDPNHSEKLKVLTLLNNQPQSLLPKKNYLSNNSRIFFSNSALIPKQPLYFLPLWRRASLHMELHRIYLVIPGLFQAYTFNQHTEADVRHTNIPLHECFTLCVFTISEYLFNYLVIYE